MTVFDNISLIHITEEDEITLGDYEDLELPDMITVSDGFEKITIYTADKAWKTQLAEFLHGAI